MTVFELCFKGNEFIKTVKTALGEYLTMLMGSEITIRDPVVCKIESTPTITALVGVRTNKRDYNEPIFLGYSQPEFLPLFQELFTHLWGFTQSSAENALIEVLIQGLEAELASKGLRLEKKDFLHFTSQTIGYWSKVPAQNLIRFPFTTPKGEINFEIPLYDQNYSEQITLHTGGFPKNARILVADHFSTARNILRMALGYAGYLNVVECKDGLEAYNKVIMSNPRFDLILSDWEMPNMSGFEMLKKIRAETEKSIKEIPLILVTGEKSKDDVLNSVRAGVSGYVVKPCSSLVLFKAMKKAAPANKSPQINMV